MTDLELAAIEARANAATDVLAASGHRGIKADAGVVGGFLVALADVPALVAEVRAARAAMTAVRHRIMGIGAMPAAWPGDEASLIEAMGAEAWECGGALARALGGTE